MPVTVVVSVIAGVVVAEATLPAKPLALTTETVVTVPAVEEVPAPIAVLKAEALNASIVLSAFILRKVIAEGLVKVRKLPPTVVVDSAANVVKSASRGW